MPYRAVSQRTRQSRTTVLVRRWPLAKPKLPLAKLKIAPGKPLGAAQLALMKLRVPAAVDVAAAERERDVGDVAEASRDLGHAGREHGPEPAALGMGRTPVDQHDRCLHRALGGDVDGDRGPPAQGAVEAEHLCR